MNHKVCLQLAIIENTARKATAHVAALKNAGFTPGFDRVKDLDALSGLLNKSVPDLVLCGSDRKLPDLEAVITLLTEKKLDIPVIAFADSVTKAASNAAIKTGAVALVACDDTDKLQAVFGAEQQAILLRRQIRQLEARLAESEGRCNALMESSRDAIACIHDGMHIHANNSYLDLFGFSGADEIEGTPVIDMIGPGDREKFGKFLHAYTSSADTDDTLEISGFEPGGGTFDAIMEFTPASINGEPCIHLIIRNRADAELEEKLNSLSRQDMLTGLCNRQHFMQVVDAGIREGVEAGQLQAVTYILLDNFKTIREEIGVAGSDMVVNDIARLIESTCGLDDTVARFSDYVFTVLRHDSNEEGVLQLAETLLQRIGEHVSDVEGQTAVTSCSIGICIINEHSSSAQSILSRADLACEVARSSGGNQIHVHSTAVDEKMDIENEAEWDEVISTTIKDERFYLVYQPIVSLNGDAGGRYEVLLRILDEEDHVILPGQFLSIAGKTGKSGEIDRWVIDTAFRTLMKQRSDGTAIEFFIKLSGTTLEDRELPVWINRKLKEYRLKSDCVCFEIPEAVAIKDLKSTMMFIKAMQKLHCGVAIEHFGCANQPRLIQHLPVDMLKIDGSLINNLASSKEQQEKVKTVIDLARKSGIQCTAERVDDASDLAKLWEFGVNFIQGNFVQEPGKSLEYDFEEELA